MFIYVDRVGRAQVITACLVGVEMLAFEPKNLPQNTRRVMHN